jgi:hypothetical protein
MGVILLDLYKTSFFTGLKGAWTKLRLTKSASVPVDLRLDVRATRRTETMKIQVSGPQHALEWIVYRIQIIERGKRMADTMHCSGRPDLSGGALRLFRNHLRKVHDEALLENRVNRLVSVDLKESLMTARATVKALDDDIRAQVRTISNLTHKEPVLPIYIERIKTLNDLAVTLKAAHDEVDALEEKWHATTNEIRTRLIQEEEEEEGEKKT